MKTGRYFTHTHRCFPMFLLVFPFMLAFLMFGCGKKKEEAKVNLQAVTLENLQTAYAKSMNRNKMYLQFADKAEKEKMKQIGKLYRAIARSEEIHAFNHAALLRTKNIEIVPPTIDSNIVGSTIQTLKMAVSYEEIESGQMYPNLVRTADYEKFPEAAAQFEMTRNVDSEHQDLLTAATDKAGKIPNTPYFVCTGCGYILTSETTDECPEYHAKKDRFEKI